MDTKLKQVKKVAKKLGVPVKTIVPIETTVFPEDLKGIPVPIKDLDEIKEAYDNGEYKTKLPYPSGKKLKPTDFIDKSKSVTWNEQEIEKKNKELDEAYKAYRTDNSRLDDKLSEDVVNALVIEFKLHVLQAKKVQGYVYREHHSSMNDYFIYLREVGELAQDLIELND
jgi:hypothetical protein